MTLKRNFLTTIFTFIFLVAGCGGGGGEIPKGEILDVWGEGRINDDGLVTGFAGVDNINHFAQRISNGPNRGKPIPNLLAVEDYNNPDFPVRNDTYKHVTLMGAPLTLGTATEMLRVTETGGKIYLYEANSTMAAAMGNAASLGGVSISSKITTADKLTKPLNEIVLRPGQSTRVTVISINKKGEL